MSFGNQSEYNAAYSDMRGVDFTSDESQVAANRFAYLKNMYKNYRSENGGAIETIPGFRVLRKFGTDTTVYGFHYLHLKDGRAVFFVHEGNYLYGIAQILTDNELKNNNSESITIITIDDEKYCLSSYTNPLVVVGSLESTSFQIGEYLYILGDSTIYKLTYNADEVTFECDSITNEDTVYIPTTYKDVPPSGYIYTEDNSSGYEYEQRNLLTDKFFVEFRVEKDENGELIRTFVLPEKYESFKIYPVKADGTMSESPLGDTCYKKNEDGSFRLSDDDGVGFFLSDYTKIVFLLTSKIKNIKGAGFSTDDTRSAKDFVLGCTKACVFDNRVFLSGNPLCPNHIFWCGFDSATGMIEPSYFGILDNIYDGLSGKITGIMAVSNTLCVLKDGDRDGNIFFHTPTSTGDDVAVKTYPNVRGITSIGCLSGCVNFLDDPVYVSALGLEGISELTAGSERIVSHRSSNVDARLLECDLTKAQLGEFEGYLLMLCEGKIFIADSRQRFTHNTGSMQYEWYYLEDIGVYSSGDKPIYVYSSSAPSRENVPGDVIVNEDSSLLGSEIRGELFEVRDGNDILLYAYSKETLDSGDTVKYLCVPKFYPAVKMICTDKTVYFITSNHTLCAFNFDKRQANGELDYKWYSFAGHIIKSGCAFKLDNVGVPHLTKSTVKKSTVIKTKVMPRSRAKVKVRTNKNTYHTVGMFSARKFDFKDIDFSDFSFLDGEQNIFLIKEKEKKWIEKQYYIYSDEYMKPFGIYNIAYRYIIAGRYKG